ncbi:MAG: MFS transporter [Legionellales bacterium RIFCSPHIGHO2_12_FULL_37_14]|nr:MAG: MFS transporter [Legionellales bacterium RIFCSPHIGHO2_12_FULL_37_14]
MKRSKENNLTFAWLVFGLAAAFYFSDYLARVAPSVMHKVLQRDFGINEAGFGLLTASFYIPYIFMQIPVGLTVDRFSIRHLLTLMAIITGIGCCIFGVAHNLFGAAIGRMLIGFSAAFAFVSALRLATAWFPPAMLGLLAGLTQALGMLGAAAGEVPVSFMVSSIGWRQTSFVMAIFFVLLALLLYRFIYDTPEGKKYKFHKEGSISIIESLKRVLTHKQTWLNALYAGFIYAPTAVIGESIGPAFLQYGRGLSAHAAAFATGLIFIGWGIGGPLTGYISDKMGRRKPVMLASAILGIILTIVLVYFPKLSTLQTYIVLFVYGLTNTGVAISYAVSTELHNRSVVGTALALTNMISIFIGALMQPVVGFFIDLMAGEKAYHVEVLSLADFQSGLKLLPACSIIAFALILMVKETNCSLQYEHDGEKS